MFIIDGDIIKITKGDTASIETRLYYTDGSPYIMAKGDKLTFTVRQTPDAPVLMSIESLSNIIDIPASESKKLLVGECCYDIQLTTASKEIYTITGVTNVTTKNMIVFDEITK